MIYYIGDMHLGHKNVIKYDDRPFDSIEEMDETLIKNWNSVVTDEDDVYIIGDFIYRSSHVATYYLKQLKGHKHLIIGNHDLKTLEDEKACEYFDSIERLGYIKDGDADIVMCHYPIAEWNGKRRKKNKSYHVYSHIHNRRDETYGFMIRQKNSLNAGCMINNYAPAILEQLIENNHDYVKKNPTYNRKNFEIITKLRNDLSITELNLIVEIIEKLKNKFEVVEEDGVFFCENVFGCEDIPVCTGFYLKLNEYKEYFEQLTYNSYLEGVFNGEL